MPATLTIACLSQKGGVCKSTLARLIATAYAQHHWNVKIADLNVKQKTSVDWSAVRLANGIEPPVAAEAFGRPKHALEQTYDLLVFDGKPDTEGETLETAKLANLVIVPTGPSVDDLKPQLAFASEMVLRGVDRQKILFVVNKTTDSAQNTTNAKLAISNNGFTAAQNDLPMKTGYQNAQNIGKAISETSYSALNEKADLLAAEIVAHIKTLQGARK